MHEQQALVNEQIKISFTFPVLIFFAHLAAAAQIEEVNLCCWIVSVFVHLTSPC